MSKTVLSTNLAPAPRGEYSQGWIVTGGKLAFISGQVSIDKSGSMVGIGDMALQTRTVLENLKGVLAGVGAEMKDVIKLNVYVTSVAEYGKISQQIRREYFKADFPASTLIEVKSLARPEYMIEIEAVAAFD